MTTWTLDERDGELVVTTDREGPAARLGHRVTLAWTRWRAVVSEDDGVPSSVMLTVHLGGLMVRSGEGGLAPLGPVERSMVRRSALKVLDARRHPTIEFRAASVTTVDGGHELSGALTISGTTRPYVVPVTTTPTAEGTRHDVTAVVRQRDFGIEPVSFFLGALVVTDAVTVSWSATRR